MLAVLALVLGAGYLARAQGSEVPRCERFTAASQQRADLVTGHGRDVVVIGDSWSMGLGLEHPNSSWPTRLDGRVSVAGFSGSGFSAAATDCGRRFAFDRRARHALRSGTDLVVVQGGLNDYDQGSTAIRAGFARLMQALDPPSAAYDVVVVGPAAAPARAQSVPQLDQLLRRLAATHGVAYVSTRDLELRYLSDGLHPTPEGHRIFGDAVADRISALPG